MSELKKLFWQFSHYLAGRAGAFVVGLISFPILTRILSVSDYGMMSLVLKVIGLFAVLSKAGVQNSILRFWDEHAASEGPAQIRRFFSSIFFGVAGTALGATLLFVLVVWAIPAAAITRTVKGLLLLGSALIFVRGMFSILGAFLRVEDKTKAYNLLDVAQRGGTIAVVCLLFFVWQRSVQAAIAGTIVVEGCVVLLMTLFLVVRVRLAPRFFDLSTFYHALIFGLPLIVYEFASVILDSGDRVLVQHYLGSAQLGLYSAAYNISSYLDTALSVPLNLAIIPIYVKLWVNKGREETQAFLSTSMHRFLMIAVGVLSATALVSSDVVIVLASPKYEEVHQLLPWLVAGLLIYTIHIFLGAGLMIYKKTYTAAISVICASALNFVMNLVLIPRMGLFAAALATLVSYAFLAALLGWAAFRVLPFPIHYGAISRWLLAGSFTVAVLWRLDLGNHVFNLLGKGLLSFLVYGATLWAVDPSVRAMFAKLLMARAPRVNTIPAEED